MALAAEADPLAVVDARRDLDRRAVRSSIARPAPSHVVHGVSTIRPAPPQRRHGLRADELAEDGVRDLLQPAGAAAGRAGRPALVPGSAPLPSQVAQATATANGTSRVTPRRRLDELDLDLGGDVARRAQRRARPPTPKRSSPKNAEKRSPRVPKSKLEGVNPPAAQAGVPVAVVELARSEFGEHLVRLDDLLEALLGVRALGDVGVQLAGQRRGRPS